MGKRTAKNVRVLCWRCQQDYITAGYRLRKVGKNIKEPCDKCGRCGYNYEVLNADRKSKHKQNKAL